MKIQSKARAQKCSCGYKTTDISKMTRHKDLYCPNRQDKQDINKDHIVGIYARVSTKDKEQNPENQLRRLREYCKLKNYAYKEYIDFASGSKKDRPGLKSIMEELDHLDGILVLRLDRFGRSLQNLLDSLKIVREKGKFFEAIDQGLRISSEKDPMNEFMLHMLAAVAEFERELIGERVRDGMARAKAQGKSISRGPSKRTIEMQKRIIELKDQGESIRMIAQKTNIPRSTVSRILTQKRNLKRDGKLGPGIYIQNTDLKGGTLSGQEAKE